MQRYILHSIIVCFNHLIYCLSVCLSYFLPIIKVGACAHVYTEYALSLCFLVSIVVYLSKNVWQKTQWAPSYLLLPHIFHHINLIELRRGWGRMSYHPPLGQSESAVSSQAGVTPNPPLKPIKEGALARSIIRLSFFILHSSSPPTHP